MTASQDFDLETVAHTLRIAELARDMTPEDRVLAAEMFQGVRAACALFGSDESIPAALMLGELMDLMLLAAKAERRETEMI